MAEKKRGLRNTRVWKRFAAICMAVVMAVTMLPIIPGAKDVYAATVRDYPIKIQFFGEDKTTPEAPSIALEDDEFYYILLTLKAKNGPDAGKAVGFCKAVIGTYRNGHWEDHEKINSGAVYQDTFSPYMGWYGPFYKINPDGTQGDSMTFDTEQYTVSSRLRHTTNDINNMTYFELNKEPDTIDGYLFLKNETNENGATISLYKAKNQEFSVRLNYDPSATDITENDHYYIWTKVQHQTGEDTYYFAPMTASASDTVTEHVVGLDTDAKWRNQNGDVIDEKFSGNETIVDLSILKVHDDALVDGSGNPRSIKEIFNTVKNDSGKYDKIAAGGLVKGYKIAYKDKQIEDDFDYDATKHVYEIDLTKVPISNDYTYLTALGDAVNYGILAKEIYQRGHSQTNVATKKYVGNGEALDPNLSGDPRGSAPGTLLIGEQEKLRIADTGTGTAVVVGGNATAADVNDSTVKVDKNKEEVNAQVQDMINYITRVSNDMASHEATITPVLSGERYVLDTRGMDPNATIYVDADVPGFLDVIKNSVNDNGSGNGLVIYKEPAQLIVFNFKTTTTVPKIGRILVNDGTEVEGTKDCLTTTEWSNAADPMNERADHAARQVVWNLNSVTELQGMDKTGGIFLNPNPESTIQANGASCGWVATAGTVEMGSGNEFHFVYKGISANNQARINARKMVKKDGATAGAEADEVFRFSIDRWDGTEFKQLTVLVPDPNDPGETIEQPLEVTNELASISIPVTEMVDGVNYYRIYETGKDISTPGAYKENKQEYFAEIKATVAKKDGVVVATIPGSVKYYKTFDKNQGKVTGPELDGSKIVFTNEESDNVAKITLTKSFGGAVVESDLETLSFEIRKPDGTVVATFELGDTDVFEKKDDGSYQMKEAYELEAGDYSVVETNYDPSGAKVSVSYSIGAGSTDYKTDGTIAGGDYLVAQTFAKDDDVVLNFKDEYPSTNVKLSKQNLGGEEIDGASLTLTGTVGTGTTPVKFTTGQVTKGAGVKDLTVSADGKTLSWISGTTLTTVNNLPNGKYTLHEVSAPTGYAVANDFKFVVKDGKVYKEDGTTEINDNKVVLIDNGSTDVVISKVMAGTTTELAGATLELTGRKADGSGAITFDLDNVKLGTGAKDKALSESDTKVSWVSGTGATTVEKLPNGIYTLTEKTAPQGFSKSEKISFILENGKVYENNAGVKGAEITDKKIKMEDECKPIEIEIKAKKTLQYSTLVAGQFSFNLKGISTSTSTVDETVTNTTDSDVNVKFSKITITEAGEYKFELTEVIPSPKDPEMTYSDEKYTVTVTVTATETGLNAEYEYKDKTGQVVDVNVPEFINTKTATPKTNVNISKKAGTSAGPELKGATLKLTGTKGTDEAGYTGAVVFDKNDVTLGTEAEWVTTTETTEELSWKSGITETLVENLPNGKYTLSEVTVPDENGFVKASDFEFILYNGDVYEVKDDGTRGDKIANKTVIMVDEYKPVKVTPSATKEFKTAEGTAKTMTADQFSFRILETDTLLPAAERVDETKGNAADGSVTFSEIAYTKAGTYTYTISETPGNDAKIKYSTEIYTMTVEVTEEATGLQADVTYKNSQDQSAQNQRLFTNTEKEEVAGVAISKKAGTSAGPELKGATLKLTGAKGTDSTGYTGGAVVFSKTDVTLGTEAEWVTTTETTEELSWKSGITETQIENLPNGKYTLSEVTVPDENGFVKASDFEFILYNGDVYEVKDDGTRGDKIANKTVIMVDEYKPVKVTPSATKEFKTAEGTAKTMTAGQFSFRILETDTLLPAAERVDETKTNAADGSVTFSQIAYTKAGTYTYTISETPGNDAGIEYSTEIYTMTVEVTEEATGLQADVTYKNSQDQSAQNQRLFTNTEKEKSTDIKISKQAVTAGGTGFGELKGATLTLTGVKTGSTDAVTFHIADVEVGEDGTLKTTVDGTTLEWISGTTPTEIKKLPNGTYTLKEKTVPDENGFQTATDIVFVVKDGKVYDATGTTEVAGKTVVMTDEYKPVSVNPVATKKFRDAAGTLQLQGGEFTFTLTKAGETEAAQTKTNDENGNVAFGAISYTEPGTYTYTIKETQGTDPDITYSSDEYTFEVEVTATDTGLVATDSYKKGGVEAAAVFTNVKAEDLGSLTIKKTVQSISGETLSKESVKVTVTNAAGEFVTATGSLTGTRTELTVPTGRTGLVINNIPVGEYTVTEVVGSTTIANYTLVTTGRQASVTEGTANITKNGTETITLVNNYERNKGQLSVTKTMVGTATPQTEFAITIKNGVKFLNASGALVDTDPKLTVTAGTPLVINNVPTGAYVVTEDTDAAQVEGYTLTANGTVNVSVTKGDTATAELTNEYVRDLGNLEITKAFAGDKPDDSLLTLTFRVTGPEDFVRELVYPRDFRNGKATLENLPTGEYLVEESGAGDVVDGNTTYIFDVAGSTTSSGPKAITKDATAKVTITNKYTKEVKGKLTVTKTVEVNGGAPADIEAKATNKAYRVQIKNEAGKFINAAGEEVTSDPGLTVSRTTSIVIDGLPLGRYTITEVSADISNVDPTLVLDDIVSVTGFSGDDAAELTETAAEVTKGLVNVYDYQQPQPDTYPVYISKADALTGDEIPGATIVLKKDGVERDTWESTTTSHRIDLEEGTYTFQETVEPKGYDKVVTEIEFKVEKDESVAEGYKVTILTASGSVEQRPDGTIVLLDAPKTGSIEITKKVTSDTGNKPEKDSFKVYVYNTTKQVYITDARGTTSDTKTALTVPVAGLSIQNAPQGEYTITEDETDAANVTGFTWNKSTSETEKTTSITVDNNNKVINGSAELKNDYTEEKGSLEITKKVGGDKPSKKSFKVTVKNAAGKYVKADGSLSDTEVILEVKVGTPLVISNLIAGKYTVTEVAKDIEIKGYTRTGGVTTTTATVVKGQTAKAEMVNNYKKVKTGKISVHVTEDHSGLDVEGAEVSITDETGKKTVYTTDEKGQVVDENGNIPEVPEGEYTVVIEKVPEGYDVKTGEIGTVVVPTDGEGHHDAVIETDRGGILITVYDEITGEVVPEATLVITTPDGEKHTFTTDENGQITEYAKKDEFGNYTSEPGEYTYTVTEVPEGYRVTVGEEQTGKVETGKLTELEAQIAPKTGGLDIKVVDEKTKNPVEGATVEVTYPDGTVHTFTTDKDGMVTELSKKVNGRYTAIVGTYKIKITKVPEGYSVKVGEVTEETIVVDQLKHHVAEIATAKEDTVQTGDSTPIVLLIILMILSAAGIAFVVIRKRKER